ncbi:MULTISPECIES: carbamate kinase [Pseudomonas]|uniref:carbamate kinase n=1 Tax=Pseudomonas TaxID=286 RepID=UPI0015E455ED|nr:MULTISPECIES: carbamate kinase [Pseudomonas]MBA1242767.1 carbamate kinase [Pseudomonas japonica]MBA1290634.1 carbamate kinase [Pseudomonas japonica]
MRILIALGGNALLRRGQPISLPAQQANVQQAMARIATIVADHELVITYGNGPQIGLLATQTEGIDGLDGYSLDLLGALTDGMLGYLIEQALGNELKATRPCATLLTRVLVESGDPAFQQPDKPIGAVYSLPEAQRLATVKHWVIAPDGNGYRRVVASPTPTEIPELRPIRWLLSEGCIVICAGGGGIPVIRDLEGRLSGVQAVVDKDRCSALLASQLDADLLILATDVSNVYTDWGTPSAVAIGPIHPQRLERLPFAAGSMAPKVQAACQFARCGKTAVIGSISEIEQLVSGCAGTRVSLAAQADAGSLDR